MATIGQQLTTPESGWRRYDDSNKISYFGTWTTSSGGSYYGNTYRLSDTTSGLKCSFKFKGTKLRIICTQYSYSNNVNVKIDGVDNIVSFYGGSCIYQCLQFEKTGLTDTIHTVDIINNTTTAFNLDAFDIDDTGYLVAQIGQALTSPDVGWKRFDDNNSLLFFSNLTGTYGGHRADAGAYNSTYTQFLNGNCKLRFYGTKIRIVGFRGAVGVEGYSDNISVAIDTLPNETMSNGGVTQQQTLLYEKTGLNLGFHTVTLTNNLAGAYANIDAIDIDDIGYLTTPIGQVLATPETGWKRYDDRNPNIIYTGNWANDDASANYNTTSKYMTGVDVPSCKITFKFYGTKVRIIQTINTTYSSNAKYKLDGVVDTVNLNGTLQRKTLVYEKIGLTLGTHTLEIYSGDSVIFDFDAIDIDSDGYLENPYIQGCIKTSIASMQMGDYIPCKYTATSGAVGTFSELGITTASEIPSTGTATPDGTFYFTKVDKGLFVADRVVQTSVSYDTLNAGGLIEGKYFSKLVIPNYLNTNIISSNLAIAVAEYTLNEAFNPTSYYGYFWGTTNNCIGYDFTTAKRLEYLEFEFIHIDSTAMRTPKDMFIEGSNDNSNWTTLWSITNTDITYWSAFPISVTNFRKFSTVFTNSNEYRYYRTRCNGSNASNGTITFKSIKFGQSTNILIRSLSGGCAYADYTNKRIVSLLLHGEGADGSTTFVDSSPTPIVITKNGNAVIKTDNKKFGSSSIYFDGSSWIDTPASTNFNFGSEDFCFDFQMKRTRIGITECVCGQGSAGGGYSTWSVEFQINPDDTISFCVFVGTTLYQAKSTNIIADLNWHHIACSRSGANIILCVDGNIWATTIVGTGVSINLSTYKFALGRHGEYETLYFKGYIDEFRVIKGKAEYTSNFTPPTQPYLEPKHTFEGAFSSTTDKGLGAYPEINEYDKYLWLSNLNGRINNNDTNVWNHGTLANWTQETPITTIGANTNRVYRKKDTFSQVASGTVNATIGFRPCLIYVDESVPTPKRPTSVFY